VDAIRFAKWQRSTRAATKQHHRIGRQREDAPASDPTAACATHEQQQCGLC
jgi:hypothetical protein